jgi:hypothetical protein
MKFRRVLCLPGFEGSFYWTLEAEGKHVLLRQPLGTILLHSKSLNNDLRPGFLIVRYKKGG